MATDPNKPTPASPRVPAPGTPRIDVAEARRRVQGGQALLVCAYDSDEKFEENRLEGGISLSEFESREDSTPLSQEIIFYCA